MSGSRSILYIWKSPYPWDVRVEKICIAFRDVGYNVAILARCGADQQSEEIIDGIKILRVGCGKPWMLTNPISGNPIWKKAISEAIETIKPDIVIPREIMLAKATAIAAQKKNIPVIMDMAEHYPAAMKNMKKYNESIIGKIAVHYLDLPERTERQSVPLMDGIITVCQEQNIRLSKEYNFSEEAMQIVHNTPSLSQFDKVRKGVKNPPTVFGHHGWMSGDKNIMNLVPGFDIAAKNYDKIELLLAGDGEYYNDIANIVKEAKHKDRIRMIGRFQPNELPEILSHIDIGCLPYQVQEFNDHTLHNKLFDYLACGKPLLCSMTQPFQRIMNETKAGLALDCSTPKKVAEAIDNLMNSDFEYFSQNAIKAAKSKYNWEVDKENLVSFIKKFI
jgi:glycosyltransferase involved in cell wall biosynthesis